MEPSAGPHATPVARWPEADRIRLDALFDALVFLTPTCFRIGHEPLIEVAVPPGTDGYGPLVEALWPVLYERCYARVFGPESPRLVVNPDRSDPEFTATLSAAHTTRPGWDRTWQVSQVGSDGSVRVRKGERFREVRPGQYAFPADPSRPPRVDESVDLLVCRESFIFQAGFYYAFGEALGCHFDDADQARIYFHATAEGISRLLGALSEALNRLEIPFLFKCRDDPGQYDRTDAALLVVSRRYLAITLRLLGQIEDQLDGLLKPGVPLFAREWGPGIGLADDPGDLGSFGQGRCLLLAQGIVNALSAGHQGREARHQALADRFAQVGLDPARPHLKAGSADRYHRPDGEPWPVQVRPSGPAKPDLTKDDAFLAVADRIGRRLCRDAFWSGGRCNWMTWTTEVSSNRSTLVHRSTPPGLFDGVAGIALFLAHLWHQTGRPELADALGGAICQLLATAPAMTNLGFSEGRLGVGQALTTIGGILEDEALIQAGISLIQPAVPVADSPQDRERWPSVGLMRVLGESRSEIRPELEAVLQNSSNVLALPQVDDLSLGRGLLGRADFLLEAAGSLGRPDLRIIAERFGRDVVERFHRPDLPWPCGVRGAGETPDLMTGTTGIGLFFLRLRDPVAVPSPLVLRPPGYKLMR